MVNYYEIQLNLEFVYVNTFSAEGFSEIQCFFHCNAHVFRSRNSEFIEAMGLNFFLNDCKLPVDAKNAIKSTQKCNSSRDIGV